jgi:glucose-6-phosphate isomerase
MQNIKLTIDHVYGFVSKKSIENYKDIANQSNRALHEGTGKGSDFLGWVNLPSSIDDAHLTDIENTAAILRENCEVVVVIGIGVVTWVPKLSSMLYPTASIGCRPTENRRQ